MMTQQLTHGSRFQILLDLLARARVFLKQNCYQPRDNLQMACSTMYMFFID